MEWTIKLEARSGWGEVETIEVGRLKRRVVGLTADEVGLTLAEGKDLLSELQRLVLQTQMEEYVMCARVCRECLTLRRQRDCRTRTPVQSAQASIERIRHLLWHGRQDQADQEIVLLMGHGSKTAERNGVSVQESTNDLTRLCTELKGYAQNNRDAIINYHRRHHGKRPVSSSRAEGCVDEIANARMGKKQRMR